MQSKSNGSGYIVKTKTGVGKTYHSHKLIGGKKQVFLNDGRKVLCSPENLKVVGFID